MAITIGGSSTTWTGGPDEGAEKYFEDEAGWLCARCEDVGARNGRKLRGMVEQDHKVIHRIKAEHRGSKQARKQPSKAFEGLRDVVHLVRGCKVMLTRNISYAYGLANGSRGNFVGVVYGPGGLGTFPEAIIVDIPEYNGPHVFYEGEPTWVPILPMTSVKEGTRMMRTQFPIVAGFALTVNKAQGLTLKEGVVIHLVGGARFRPAAKHGLPFVAWTRSESFKMTAFKNLPPWSDFEKGRDSDMLRMRNAFMRSCGVVTEKHFDGILLCRRLRKRPPLIVAGHWRRRRSPSEAGRGKRF